MEVDGLTIDPIKRIASRDDDTAHLTPEEYDLLLLLARHAGRVVTYRTLLCVVTEWATRRRKAEMMDL